MSRLLRFGALAGAAGGVALALVLRVLGEVSIGDAIAIERAAADPGAPHEEMFSRATQQIGGMMGAALYGVALGLVLAVVLAAVRHRLGWRDDWRRGVALGVTGFLTIALIPALKYPPNPPAVGNPDTIDRRTILYLALVAWSVLTTWAAWRMWRWLKARPVDEPARLAAVALTYAALVVAAFVILPGTPDAVTAPATLVWRFRLASLAGSLTYWLVAGGTLGWLLLRRPGELAVTSAGDGLEAAARPPAVAGRLE